ncbi:hypothetical protein K493DRAFT_308226 [Basidiobolus meristosporus CBS 931.73]|uniref:Bromo domain-containing protein n=1 Tax=Basidiobolus meristosporus CBS 931.73 TaxID=1314790 RepID=A0A1Y1X4Z8_9FUNG|nr:hypothetical protein K493DRAFT_308226 [Basidiobolus meristosporus CBS 931.73]|eukprot:ORX80853.1 hypothetical protein K493DRAFT_308226 [Basidiobolus meristosporus CBS 931.73]
MTFLEEATPKRLKISLKVPAAKSVATEHSEQSSKNSDLSDVSSFWSDEEEEEERASTEVYSEAPSYGSGKKRKLTLVERSSSESDEDDLDSGVDRRKNSLIDVKEEPSESMFKRRKSSNDIHSSASLVSSQSPDKNGVHTKIVLKSGHNKALGSPVSNKHGQSAKPKELSSTLHKLLESFIKKDAYGFFLEPVDTSVVTDYREIIKNPMDFGTIRKKIEKRFYRSLDEFKLDFELVCNNAKTYNAPETLYYKSAHKIWQYGLRAIEKERPNVVVERISPKLEDDVDVEGLMHENHGNRATDSNHTPMDITRAHHEAGATAAESSRSQTPMKVPAQRGRKPSAKSAIPKRLFDGQFKYSFRGDGSLDPGADLDSFIPQASVCPEVPNLTVITSFSNPFTENVFKRASFLDYGPFATLGPAPPPVSNERSNFLFNTYGDERGFAYSQSIQEFLKDVGGDLDDYCQTTLDKLTKGAHKVANKVQEAMERKLDKEEVETDLGRVNVSEEIRRLERLPKLRQEISELEQWRKQVIDLDVLFKDSDWKQPEVFSTRIDQGALQSALDKNKEAIQKLVSSPPNSTSTSAATTESPADDAVKGVGAGVIVTASEPELPSDALTQSAPNLAPSTTNSAPNGLAQPSTSESTNATMPQNKDTLQEELRIRLFQLARCAPTSEISTQRPILRLGASVVSPISMSRTVQGLPTTPASIKVAPRIAKPPSASPTPTKTHKPNKRHDPDKPQLKCANCGTSDTPGWRAGETPDTKLCNACGLYFAKNKTHRPSHLWNR